MIDFVMQKALVMYSLLRGGAGGAVATLLGLIIGSAYYLSPVDLIPDAIPVVGTMDDALMAPLLTWQVVKRMVPPERLARLEERAVNLLRDMRSAEDDRQHRRNRGFLGCGC